MKAVLYKDLMTLKNQKKNFLLSLFFLLIFPFIIKHNKISFIDTNMLFLFVSSLIPATIGLQFANYLLLEDKKSEMFPLLFRNGLSIPKYYFSKIVIPLCVAFGFNFLSFLYYSFLFENLTSNYDLKELILLFFISSSLTIIALWFSESLIFVIENDVYYPTACVILSIVVIGLVFYYIKPFEHIFIFILTVLFIGIVNYLALQVLLKRKYSYFGS
jgi:hypothetical protein